MIETKVPKDIRAYDIRVAGPFTIRQIILILLAVVLDCFVWKYVIREFGLPVDHLMYVILILDIPILAFAIKPMGMKMEQYLNAVVRCNFLPPQKRKVSNTVLIKQEKVYTDKELKQERKRIRKEMQNHPEYKAYS